MFSFPRVYLGTQLGTPHRSIQMAASVGDDIEVFWPLDNEYYPATVTAVQPTSRLYTLSYFDGEVEDIHLLKESWRFLSKNNTPEEITSPPNEPKIEEVDIKKKNHPEPAEPAAQKISTTTTKTEESSRPCKTTAYSTAERNTCNRSPPASERKLANQPKRRRLVPKNPLSEPAAVSSKPATVPPSTRRASLRQKGYRPELLKGLSEHGINKRRKRILSNSSLKSDSSSTSSSTVDYEEMRPAHLLIAGSIHSWLRLETRNLKSSQRQCLQYSLNILTSAAANAVYLENLKKKKQVQNISLYFEPEAQNHSTEKLMKSWKRPGKELGNESEILQVVSKLVFRACGGVKPKKNEKPVVTAMRLVLRALTIM